MAFGMQICMAFPASADVDINADMGPSDGRSFERLEEAERQAEEKRLEQLEMLRQDAIGAHDEWRRHRHRKYGKTASRLDRDEAADLYRRALEGELTPEESRMVEERWKAMKAHERQEYDEALREQGELEENGEAQDRLDEEGGPAEAGEERPAGGGLPEARNPMLGEDAPGEAPAPREAAPPAQAAPRAQAGGRTEAKPAPAKEEATPKTEDERLLEELLKN